MILICLEDIGQEEFIQKYSETSTILSYKNYDTTKKDWLINYMEQLKKLLIRYEIVFLDYFKQIFECLDVINTDYSLIIKNDLLLNNFKDVNCSKILIQEDETLEITLKDKFDWITIDDKLEEIEDNNTTSNLTLEKLVNEDLDLTDADIQQFKVVESKLKAGLLLQAKSSLNRVLKLTNVLDKLYDELIDRLDTNLEQTSMSSLMNIIENISKALNDTNQFILSLINNDKIQNFFIIDNSNVVNISDDGIDIDGRERLRKATEIVLNNIDYFVDGEYNKMENPNAVETTKIEEDKKEE